MDDVADIEQEIKQGIDFTDKGHRVLVFYDDDNKKQEPQKSFIDLMKQYLDAYVDAHLFSINPLLYCHNKQRRDENGMLDDNRMVLENINIEGLKFYDIEGCEEHISSNPKLETIYIQDSEDKKLFISQYLYNKYIYEKMKRETKTVLNNFPSIGVKITPSEEFYKLITKIDPSFRVGPFEFQTPEKIEDDNTNDDSIVPNYLKDVIDLIKHKTPNFDTTIPVLLEYLNQFDKDNQKVGFFVPIEIATIRCYRPATKENKQ